MSIFNLNGFDTKATHLCVYILKLLMDSPLEVSKKLLSSSKFEKNQTNSQGNLFLTNRIIS